jgi:translation initiation factor 2 beta subunit (eIF-2beta)/eIF-5
MNKMNIQGNNDINDPFYRYKMEKLNVISQKNKTVIDNIKKVCDDLSIDPVLLYKFFKKKFSTSMKMDKQYILSTSTKITYNEFEKVLREFIEKYVLCRQCSLPELNYTIEKNKTIRICKSCSYTDFIKK